MLELQQEEEYLHHIRREKEQVSLIKYIIKLEVLRTFYTTTG